MRQISVFSIFGTIPILNEKIKLKIVVFDRCEVYDTTIDVYIIKVTTLHG